MMEIVWSDEALRNYFKVLDYLFGNWSVNEIENFENSFDELE
ncbi:type II toxin-antitoxin system RelE/ParE family toxin [Chryseobacterium sp. FH1]|nr:type II toxin-antitoxin system RelE/ParE family toxin [Chryseobacterium sp. FH1]